MKVNCRDFLRILAVIILWFGFSPTIDAIVNDSFLGFELKIAINKRQ